MTLNWHQKSGEKHPPDLALRSDLALESSQKKGGKKGNPLPIPHEKRRRRCRSFDTFAECKDQDCLHIDMQQTPKHIRDTWTQKHLMEATRISFRHIHVCMYVYIYMYDYIWHTLYYLILYYIILYYIIVYYIILYYIILYYIILYYIILYHIILYYIVLYYIILYHTILYYIILYYIILYFIILYYILLYYIILYHIWTYIYMYIYILYSRVVCV